ncbi:transmembrane protein [Thraustotheca clavata]|uniref:Transmembrane protein n=1 Tax=Thraustotheca clavata TaxID=74557 RepID=A0A1V9ZE58_9STRA|nr:transmembrane protein [Thraustotheca clavata]
MDDQSTSTSPVKGRAARHRRTRSVGLPEEHEDFVAAMMEENTVDGSDSERGHRRTKSFESHEQLMGIAQAPRSRGYTKSLKSLVKHLAPEGNQSITGSAISNKCTPTGTASPIHPPRRQGQMNAATTKVWSPRQDAEAHRNLVDTSKPLEYEFALVLHNKPARARELELRGLDPTGVEQREVIRRCIDAGLDVTVLASTVHTRKYLCLLLKPTPQRMRIERNRLAVERWLQIGAVGEVPSEIEQLIYASDLGTSPTNMSQIAEEDEDDCGDLKFTPAERIQTIGRIITSTSDIQQLNPPGANISIEDDNTNDPIIAACFPLHNRKVNAMLLSKKHCWWTKSEELTNAIRFHYGERVAFHFSFIFLYTKWLLVPATIGTILYLSLRWYSAIYYMTSLSIFGFVTVIIWGTLFLKFWQRQNEYLNDAWNVRLFKEAEYPNPRFEPHGYRDIVDSSGALLFKEPYYNPLYRLPAMMQTFFIFFLFTLTYVVGTTFFVQWYTAAMLAPVCSECPDCQGFLSCFDTVGATVGTWRWVYILVQGIFLGVTLDIFVYLLSVKLLRFFVVRENHATEAQIERTMINRLFIINWISFFLWFMLIAFVVVPFGEPVEDWLSSHFRWTRITVRWREGRIDMSTALVTPLLITQALNLLIDTALPNALRKRRLNAFRMARRLRANPADTMLALSEAQRSHTESSRGRDSRRSSTPSTDMSQSINFQTKIELQMITPMRIPYIENDLQILIPSIEGFENDKEFTTADTVVEESQLELYDCFVRRDYLKMVIQFGYVVMFSVVWPFCGLAAVVNNAVHIQNCFHKLCLTRRRPVPRKANSIGQWEKTLYSTLFLGVFAVVGLICISSGEVEYFVGNCLALERFNGSEYSMTPEFSCFSLPSRFLVALLLEHVGLALVYLILDNISDTPTSLRSSFELKKELIRRAIGGQSHTHSGYTYTPQGHANVLNLNHHLDACRKVMFSEDGNTLYTASSDKSIRAYDTTGGVVWAELNAHAYPVNSMHQISNNVFTSGDDQGCIKMWDVRQHRCVVEWKEHTGGKKVVCGSQDGVLVIFSWGTWGDMSDRFPGHPDSVETMLKVDEDTILTGSSDGIIRVVQIHPNKLLGLIGDHEDFPVEVLEFSHDRRIVGSVSHSNKVQFWDVGYLYDEDDDEEDDGEEAKELAFAPKEDESMDSDSDSDDDEQKQGGRKAAPTQREAFFSDL